MAFQERAALVGVNALLQADAPGFELAHDGFPARAARLNVISASGRVMLVSRYPSARHHAPPEFLSKVSGRRCCFIYMNKETPRFTRFDNL
jgi:hypothetical protein